MLPQNNGEFAIHKAPSGKWEKFSPGRGGHGHGIRRALGFEIEELGRALKRKWAIGTVAGGGDTMEREGASLGAAF